jgi:RNA polymerase sigma factor (sigma-70 family)
MMIEKHIWDNFRKGSISSFEKFYEMYFDALYLYAYHLKPGSDEVEDVVHDVFLELWGKRERLPDVTHVKAYLMKIVRRKIFSGAKKPIDQIESEVILSVEHILIEKEEEDLKKLLILSCLKNLTPRQKEIIHLKYYENLSAPEIMSITGLSQQRVYNIISETLATLRSMLIKNSVFFSVGLFIVLSLFIIA